MNYNNLKILVKSLDIRALEKTITWRIVATIITGVIVYLYTGQLAKSGKITLVVAIFLTIGYYIHERLWQRRDG